MKTLRIRPKSDYMHTASWEELYVLSEHWQSDLDFYRDELKFLESLVSKYYLSIASENKDVGLHDIVKGLAQMQKDREILSKRIKEDLKSIEIQIDNPFSHDEQSYREDRSKIEEELTDFVKNFRGLKSRIFNVAKDVLEDQKSKHLLK